jgi:hypothetical protein
LKFCLVLRFFLMARVRAKPLQQRALWQVERSRSQRLDGIDSDNARLATNRR